MYIHIIYVCMYLHTHTYVYLYIYILCGLTSYHVYAAVDLKLLHSLSIKVVVNHKLLHILFNLVEPGAYEPPKAAKEHETQFHDNPNNVTTFENS